MDSIIPPTMQAVVYRQGRGLVREEVRVPSAGPDSVLVRVAHTGFCGTDHSLLKSGGLADGTILGHMDFAPVVLSEPVAAKRDLGTAFGAHAVMDPLAEDTGPRVFELTAGPSR